MAENQPDMEAMKHTARDIGNEIHSTIRAIQDGEGIELDTSYATLNVHSFDVEDYEIDTASLAQQLDDAAEWIDQLSRDLESHECMVPVDSSNVWQKLADCIDFLKQETRTTDEYRVALASERAAHKKTLDELGAVKTAIASKLDEATRNTGNEPD